MDRAQLVEVVPTFDTERYPTIGVMPLPADVVLLARRLCERHGAGSWKDPEYPNLMISHNRYQPSWWSWRTEAAEHIEALKALAAQHQDGGGDV